MNPYPTNPTPTISTPWLHKARLACASLAFSILAACGGGGGAGIIEEEQTAPRMQAAINSNVVAVDSTTLQTGLISSELKTNGQQTMTVKADSVLTNLKLNQIVFLPNVADANDGIFMKVVEKTTGQGGVLVFTLQTPVPGEVFSSVKISTESLQAGLNSALGNAQIYPSYGVTVEKPFLEKIATQLGLISLVPEFTDKSKGKYALKIDFPVTSPVKPEYRNSPIYQSKILPGCINFKNKQQDKNWVNTYCTDAVKLSGNVNVKIAPPVVKNFELNGIADDSLEVSNATQSIEKETTVDGSIEVDLTGVSKYIGDTKAEVSVFELLKLPSDEELFKNFEKRGFGDSNSFMESNWIGLSAEDKKAKIPLAGIGVEIGSLKGAVAPVLRLGTEGQDQLKLPAAVRALFTIYAYLDMNVKGEVKVTFGVEETKIKQTQEFVSGAPNPAKFEIKDKNGNSGVGDIYAKASASATVKGVAGVVADLDVLVANIRVVNINGAIKAREDVQVDGYINYNISQNKIDAKGCYSAGFRYGFVAGVQLGSKIKVRTGRGWYKAEVEGGFNYKANFPDDESSTTIDSEWPYWKYVPASNKYCAPAPKITKVDAYPTVGDEFIWDVFGENLPEDFNLHILDNVVVCDKYDSVAGLAVGVIPVIDDNFAKAQFSCKRVSSWVPNNFDYKFSTSPDVNWASGTQFTSVAPTIDASSLNLTVGEQISLKISKAYQTVKSVVWSFADAIGTQTASVVEGISTAITHVFSSIGSTLVTATLQDAANKVLGTLTTTTINVSALPMPTVYITGATSDTATQPGDIALNGTTNDTTPVLKGTLSAALKGTQHVNIYDGSTQFVAYANVVGTSWTFTPATPLTSGAHSFTADVSDELANTGPRSISYVINISASPASPFTDIGQNNGFNNPTLETVYEIKKIGLDTSDGTLRLPLTVGEVDSTFPYIWIANSGEGTISKLATRDHYRKSPQTGEQELVKVGQELGRYRTGPENANGNPSRTTVDQDGNVWVGNRNNNTITKVGLFEFGNCIDRNGNGKIDTSTGKDDLKDWGGSFGDGQGFVNALDECVLQHVNLQAEGVDTPTDIRLIAIDKDNNVFAGGTGRQSIFKVNGRTGQIIKGAMTNGSFYGGLIDKNNNLWAASRITGYRMVHKVSNDLNNSEIISANLDVYGIALDKYGKIWVTNAYAPNFATFNPADIAGTLTVFSQQGRNSGGCYAQGVAVDDNDNIFIAGGHSQCASDSVVGHYKQVANGSTTSVQFVANYQVSSGPTGVAVDGKGNVWSTDYSNNAVSRITLAADPVNAKIDTFPVGATPYNYSDMTGRTVRNITNRQGTWEAIFDGGVLNFEWKKLVWSLKNQLPQGTAVAAYAKTANSKVDLGGKQYQQVENNLPLSGMKGQFIKIKFVLTSADSKSTPEITGIDFQ